MVRGKSRQLDDTGSEKRLRPVRVLAAIMMKCRCDLNDALQKCSFRFDFHQPDLLPNLMGFEKFPSVEMRDAALKFLVFFLRIHPPEILFPLNFLKREPS